MHCLNPSRENLDQFQRHFASLEHSGSFVPDRFLFRVDFDGSERGFTDASHFAPLAHPAFEAGDRDAPTGLVAQLAHCGGCISDRDQSPYISCSRDLLWCLWLSTMAVLGPKRSVLEMQIYIIEDGDEYNDIQTNMYCREYWSNIGDSEVIDKVIKRAKKRAIAASEVLVYKEIARERVLGVLRLDQRALESAGLDRVFLSHTGKRNYHGAIAAISQNGLQEEIASLAEWCETSVISLKCIGQFERCSLRGLFNALFPLVQVNRVISFDYL